MKTFRVDRSKPFRLAVAATAVALGATFAAEATAGDRHRARREARVDAARVDLHDARDYDRRLDRRGRAIDRQLDLFAFVAAAAGEWSLAERLDRKGDRIERRLDRRGDRALRDARADLRDARARRGHHHHGHVHGRDRCPDDHRHTRFDRRDRDRERRFDRDRSWERRRDRDRHERHERMRDRERRDREERMRDRDRRDRRDDRGRRSSRRHGDVSSHPAGIGDDIARSVRLGRTFHH